MSKHPSHANTEDQSRRSTKTTEYRHFHKLLKQVIKAPPLRKESFGLMDNAARIWRDRCAHASKIGHLLSIGPPRDKREATIGPSNYSEEEPPQTPRHVPVIAPTPKKKTQTTESDSGHFPWWRLVEGLGVAGVVIAAGANVLLWHDANRNFMVDERPWIRIEFAPNKLIEGDPGNPHTVSNFETGKPISVDIRMRNGGKTPATAVEGHFFIRLLQ